MADQLLGLPSQHLGDFLAPISFICNVDNKLNGNGLLNIINVALG